MKSFLPCESPLPPSSVGIVTIYGIPNNVLFQRGADRNIPLRDKVLFIYYSFLCKLLFYVFIYFIKVTCQNSVPKQKNPLPSTAVHIGKKTLKRGSGSGTITFCTASPRTSAENGTNTLDKRPSRSPLHVKSIRNEFPLTALQHTHAPTPDKHELLSELVAWYACM